MLTAKVSDEVAADTLPVCCMHIRLSMQSAHLFELLRLHSGDSAPLVALGVEAGYEALGLRPKHLVQADAPTLTCQHLPRHDPGCRAFHSSIDTAPVASPYIHA